MEFVAEQWLWLGGLTFLATLMRFDASVGDTAEKVKSALDEDSCSALCRIHGCTDSVTSQAQKAFNVGRDPADTRPMNTSRTCLAQATPFSRLDILLRDGKTAQLEVKTEEPGPLI